MRLRERLEATTGERIAALEAVVPRERERTGENCRCHSRNRCEAYVRKAEHD